MIVEGRPVVIAGDDVDTDVMYPGAYLNIEDPDEMKQYLFEGYDPSLREQLGDDAILVTGRNFGVGSSREHVVQALKAWGVRAVLGKSFARIFRRNCVNLGLPIFECPGGADAARSGSRLRIDTESGFSSGSQVSSWNARKISSTGLPIASSSRQPVSASATGLM